MMNTTDAEAYWKYKIPIFPPTSNQIWRTVGPKKVVLSKEARNWYKDAALFITGRGKNRVGPWTVKLTLYPPNARKIDIDNRIKSVLDLFNRVEWWLDDSEVLDLRVFKMPPCAIKPGVTVEIWDFL